MLKIGDFSKFSRISVRMLRHYDELGLLVPAHVDGFTGYRYYSERQLTRANRILALREMGFGLAAVGEILSVYEDPDALKNFLQLRRLELQEEAHLLEQRLLLLESTLQRMGKDEMTMKYNVIAKELPRRYVASVRRIIPSYQDEGTLWEIMRQEAEQLRMQPGDPCYGLAIFHDAEFKEGDVDVEIQMAVKGTYADNDRVAFRTVEPQLVASVTYQGSYDQANAVNGAMASWISDNGYRMDGPMLNIYHVGPHMTQDPEQWVTESCIPIQKK